ncbi:MAG TPA: hypothetical protein VFR42_07770 [Candidatus Acidoferrum sp.]|nr:hypothetical protein [Candidatus Acidoferrum sp.]
MANCAPCLKLGLQVVAHYDADLRAGKEAECYYHHFGMTLPASLQEKIAKPKPQPETEAEETGAPILEKTKPRPDFGVNSRPGLNPDVCAECWRNGHVCKPHCTVDGERLCIDCADGKPCAHVRAKEENPQARPHERYRVTIPSEKKAEAPRPTITTIPANISLSLDAKGVPARAVSATRTPPSKPAPEPEVPTAGKDRQKKERTHMKLTDEQRAQQRTCPFCKMPLRRDNTKGICTSCRKKGKRLGDEHASSAPAPIKTDATPEPESGLIALKVTEAHLDNFLVKLPLEEKIAIVQKQLAGA